METEEHHPPEEPHPDEPRSEGQHAAEEISGDERPVGGDEGDGHEADDSADDA